MAQARYYPGICKEQLRKPQMSVQPVSQPLFKLGISSRQSLRSYCTVTSPSQHIQCKTKVPHLQQCMFYSWHGAETVSDELWLPVCPLPTTWMTDANIWSSSRMILTETNVHNGYPKSYTDCPQCKPGPHSEEKIVTNHQYYAMATHFTLKVKNERQRH